jgi:plastocyanin
MTSFSWDTAASGDWNTGTLWASGAAPDSATADVTIDAVTTIAGGYTVTIAAGESVTINSLTLNDTDASRNGTNHNPYTAAVLTLDGTLAFGPSSPGFLGNSAAGGSLQTIIFTDFGAQAEIVNAGTIDGFIQVQGDLLLTGTNGVYITNDLQALGGTVTIDTKSIAEISGTLLFDGIFEAVSPGAAVNLGGAGGGLVVNIATIEGPPLNPGGWTELTFNGPNTSINEWNGSAYVSVETTLTEIKGAGTVDVLTGRDYTTTHTLTIDAGTGTIAPGMLNLRAGTVTTAGIDINGGIVQGAATIVGGVVNNGTLIALDGTMDLTGSLAGAGVVRFDIDVQAGTVDLVGATLIVNSVSAGQTIVMNGSDTLKINSPETFAGRIEAAVGDKIILEGLTATSAMVNAGTLVVFNGTQTVASMALAGAYTADHVIATGSTLTFAAGAAGGPTITGAVAGQTVADQATITPFSSVVIGDANIDQTETVTVTLSAPGNGTLSNLGGGSYNTTTGVFADTGSAAAVTSTLAGLVFTPTAHEVAPGQTVTTVFTISDTDTASASATNSTTSVIVTTGTITPTITGAVAGQTVTDQATITPFSGVMIGDANIGQTETVTVTLSTPGNGTLSNLGGGSYNAAAGVFTDTGSAAAVTSTLAGLVFTPTAHEVAPGQTVSTIFTINDTDTASASAINSSTSVIATAVPLPIRNFAITDTTTGVATTSAGTAYSGPVVGLQNEYITVTTDSLAITAITPNTFIHTGSGDDAIDVSHVSGTNVLDGSTGSNFLVGGAGFDTFFVDDRSPSSAIWSTVSNFHSGDAATIFGITQSDFSLQWVDGQGANGYTGLTLHVTAAGVPTASLTLAGFTTADLTDGRLSVSFGSTAAFDGVAGSTYMNVHAN